MTEKTENGDAAPQEARTDDNVGGRSANENQTRARRDAKSNDSLSRALRNNYQSTVDEGVPDIFQDLIQKLK